MNRGSILNPEWTTYANKQEDPPTPPRRPGRTVLRWMVFLVACVVYLGVSTSVWIFNGPFHYVRTTFIDTVDETRHGYLLRPLSLFTVTEAEIKAHALTGGLVSVTAPVNQISSKDFTHNNSNLVQVQTYHGATYTAHIMIISDPNRVKVATTKYIGQRGETVQQMVADTGAIAGINGGSFSDNKQQGTGAQPLGITIQDGQVITGANSTAKHPEIAFTDTGQMIAGNYSLADLRQENVTEALSFGPVLVMDGKPVTVPDIGYNPRTAIGQTADGKVIFIVTDGRGQFGHLGASMADITALMLRYHAYIAANLDGGSSATMVYQGKLVNTPVDLTGARSVATSFVVMPETGGQQ